MQEPELFPKWIQYGYVSEEAYKKMLKCYKWFFLCGPDTYSRIHEVDMNKHSYFLHSENFFNLNRRKIK